MLDSTIAWGSPDGMKARDSLVPATLALLRLKWNLHACRHPFRRQQDRGHTDAYCWTTGAEADAPCRGEGAAAGRAGFLAGAGFAAAGAPVSEAEAFAAAGGAGSSAGSTVSFWVCFSIALSLATFFEC